MANRLCQLVMETGLSEIGLRVHRPTNRAGKAGLLLKWSVQEAGPAFVHAGLITADELGQTVASTHRPAGDPHTLAVARRISLVSGRKILVLPWPTKLRVQ